MRANWCAVAQVGVTSGAAPPVEAGRGPAGVGRVEVDAGRDDGIDRVEHVAVELDLGGTEQVGELVLGARPEQHARHGRMLGGPRQRELGERQAGVVGHLASDSTASAFATFSPSKCSGLVSARDPGGVVARGRTCR